MASRVTVTFTPTTPGPAQVPQRTGAPFDAAKGRPMKEWLSVEDAETWRALAGEALDFVRWRRA